MELSAAKRIREMLARREADWLKSDFTSLYDQGAMDAYRVALSEIHEVEDGLCGLLASECHAFRTNVVDNTTGGL